MGRKPRPDAILRHGRAAIVSCGAIWRMSTFHGQNRPKGASLPSMMLTVWRPSDYVRLTIMFVPVLPRVAAFSPLANSPPAISPAANGPPAKSPLQAAIRPPLALSSSTASCTVAPSGVIPYRRVPLGRVRL